MRSVVLVMLVLGAGCSHEIGDSCSVDTDCSTDGTRTCDISQNENGGYCTIIGCDYDTCPGEATCVSFFSGGFDNRPCDEATEDKTTNDCSDDELCDLAGECVPRSAEVRYCMRTCSSNGDCRDGYECRDLNLMIEHGGEPVLAPGIPVDNSAPHFCAAAPAS